MSSQTMPRGITLRAAAVNSPAESPPDGGAPSFDGLGRADLRGPSQAIEVPSLHVKHTVRAAHLATLLPLVPECAAVVFTALDQAEKRSGSSSYAFLARLMEDAAERVRTALDAFVSVTKREAGAGELRREVWRNHHLIKNMQLASPELRQIIRGVLDVLSAEGIRGRLGEPGFLDELSQRAVTRFAATAALFKVGAQNTPPPSYRLLVRDLSRDLRGHYSEFSVESFSTPAPLIPVARRAAHHAWCARELARPSSTAPSEHE